MSNTAILAIETSCDETGVAVAAKEGEGITVLAEYVASQVDVHALTGGVVPEVAAREHVAVIHPLIKSALKQAQLAGPDLAAIAVTTGPGLMPALTIGVAAARTLAYAWDKPLVPVHHIEGHLYSALLSEATGNEQRVTGKDLPATIYQLQPNTFPALALIVSGGHTLLILIRDHLQYEVLGSTRDDAAGEAFDKVARLLNLPYPGGPHVSKLADSGDPAAFPFTRPMLRSGDLDFSFSGLKTEVLYTLRDLNEQGIRYDPADIAASFQQAVVDTLVTKTEQALEEHQPTTLLVAGGVAANQQLRRDLQAMADRHNTALRIAPLKLCGDNAVMIGQVAVYALQAGRTISWNKIDAHARVNIETFST